MKQRKMMRLWFVLVCVIAICVYWGSRSEGVTRAKTPTASQSDVHSIAQGERVHQATDHGLAAKEAPAKERDSNAKKKELAQLAINGEGITAIGDSVMIGVKPYLKEQLPEITVDGKVGRQMSQAKKVIHDLQAQGKLGEQIVIELGTNGPFSKEQLRSLLQSLSDAKRVVLVTARVPKGWQDTVNRNIKEVAEEFSNTTVLDWYAASEGKGEYFYKDGVHLKPDGGRYYASLIVEALQDH